MNTFTGAIFVATPKQSRAVVTGRRDCFTGWVPSHKPGNDYRLIAFEGTIERDFIYLIEDDDEIVSYQEQPPQFRWHDGNQYRKYTPDFKLQLEGGRRIGIEIKPLAVVEKHDLIPVYGNIRQTAVESGEYDDFQLWTDRDIRESNDLENARIRYSERHQHQESMESVIVRAAFDRLNGRARIEDLRRETGIGNRAYRAIVRMMAEGDACLENNDLFIEDNSFIVWEAV